MALLLKDGVAGAAHGPLCLAVFVLVQLAVGAAGAVAGGLDAADAVGERVAFALALFMFVAFD